MQEVSENSIDPPAPNIPSPLAAWVLLRSQSLNILSPMKNATIPAQPTPTTNQTYSPSVPISLYREVMAELQTTQAHLNALKQENRELNQENQQLRQEIENIINSVMHLQQVTGISPQSISASFATATSMPPSISPATPPEGDRLPSAANMSAKSAAAAVASSAIPFVSPFATGQPGGLSDRPEALFTEQPEPRPRRVARSPKSSEVGGLWLFVCIFLIVVSAFGVGFFVIRPFMQPDRE